MGGVGRFSWLAARRAAFFVVEEQSAQSATQAYCSQTEPEEQQGSWFRYLIDHQVAGLSKLQYLFAAKSRLPPVAIR